MPKGVSALSTRRREPVLHVSLSWNGGWPKKPRPPSLEVGSEGGKEEFNSWKEKNRFLLFVRRRWIRGFADRTTQPLKRDGRPRADARPVAASERGEKRQKPSSGRQEIMNPIEEEEHRSL